MNAKTHYLAVDLGATSGRTILAGFDGSKVEMRELTRFKHPMVPIGGHLYWDLPHLYNEILEGLKKVAAEEDVPLYKLIAAVSAVNKDNPTEAFMHEKAQSLKK